MITMTQRIAKIIWAVGLVEVDPELEQEVGDQDPQKYGTEVHQFHWWFSTLPESKDGSRRTKVRVPDCTDGSGSPVVPEEVCPGRWERAADCRNGWLCRLRILVESCAADEGEAGGGQQPVECTQQRLRNGSRMARWRGTHQPRSHGYRSCDCIQFSPCLIKYYCFACALELAYTYTTPPIMTTPPATTRYLSNSPGIPLKKSPNLSNTPSVPLMALLIPFLVSL